MDWKHIEVVKQMGMAATAEAGLSFDTGLLEADHVFSSHIPLWKYENPALQNPFAPELGKGNVFDFLPDGTTVAEAARKTGLLVFLGAEDTPQLRQALAEEKSLKFVIEPDPERLEGFLSKVGVKSLVKRQIFFLAGGLDDFKPPLLMSLPPDICQFGYPVFFVQKGLDRACPEYVDRAIEALEIFYYRHVIYPLGAQEHVRGRPLRKMERLLIYDRVKHNYENLAVAMRSGGMEELEGALEGETAILVAAGPALDAMVPFLQANRENAALIAVNNALRTLLANGLEPDFTVINDTSVLSGRTFQDLPTMAHCRLVAHCQSCTGGGVFQKIHLFGNTPKQPFPPRREMLLHGSVITTAFSLAELLGCKRAVLVASQLSSPNPGNLDYSKQSLQSSLKLETRHPLAPVQAANGNQVYTSLNFLDVAWWFRDRIRMSSLEVVNTCPESLLYGGGIIVDPEPALPSAHDLRERIASIPCQTPRYSLERVQDYAKKELGYWRERLKAAQQMLRYLNDGPAALPEARRLIGIFDSDNTSFMLQRFDGFLNASFHKQFFDSQDTQENLEGARYYFTWLERMSQALFDILLQQLGQMNFPHTSR